MGLMDKVRAQGSQLAQVAQDAAREGKVKLDQAQAKRRADALFRDLGAAVYAERTGRGSPDSKDRIDRLVNALSRQEADQGLGETDGKDSSDASPSGASGTGDSGSGASGSGASGSSGASRRDGPRSGSSGAGPAAGAAAREPEGTGASGTGSAESGRGGASGKSGAGPTG